MNKKILMNCLFDAVLIAIVLMNTATALNTLNCFYDSNPNYNFIDNKIKWICETDSATKCISYIKDLDGYLLDSNPNIEYLRDFGEVSYFNCPKICNVYFDTRYIIDNTTAIFGVACENLEFQQNITAHLYLNQFQSTNRIIWVKDNFGYILLFFFLVALGIALLFWVIRKIRGG